MKRSFPVLLFLLNTLAVFAQTYTTVSTFAGTGSAGLVNGPVGSAKFNFNYGICTDPAGNIYVADDFNNCIRKITNGVVTTLAGNGVPGDVDAQGANARFNNPTGVYYMNGYLYVADNLNNKIKRIDASANVVTIAGTGIQGYQDGAALSARFYQPKTILVDNNNVVYVADYENHCIRRIANGMVTTYAGIGGVAGDVLGSASTAKFHRPRDLCIDPAGNIYVADLVNNKIKMISTSGMVTLVAGSGTASTFDGIGSGASFNLPIAIDWGLSGDLFILDSGSGKIRRMTTGGVVTTIAGSGIQGYLDGPVGTARFGAYIQDLCFDLTGNLYVSDRSNNVIRVLWNVLSAQVTSYTDVSCNAGANGSATVAASGGLAPYYYAWSPSGGNAATASGLAAGTYTCTITDSNGNITQQVITISQPPALSATATAQPASCMGNGSAFVTASGGTGPYSYAWSPGGGTTDTAGNLSAGSYTCTITDANGCSTTAGATVTTVGPPVASLQFSSGVSCYGGSDGSATVNVTGSGPFTYSWSPGGGNSATAGGLSIGSYTCTVTDNYGCITTQTVNISQPAPITASFSSSPATCGGNDGFASVSASGGTGSYTYNWSPSGGAGATAVNLVSGNYSVTITDSNGCSTVAATIIASIGGPSVSLQSTNNPTCFGSGDGAVTLSASGNGPFTYGWSPSGGNASTASGLPAGSYTCMITDANGCITTQSVTLTEPTPVAGVISSTPASCGNNNGTASVTASGGVGGYSYNWSPTGGNSSVATGLGAGTYSVIITDTSGCFNTVTVTIANNGAPSVSLQSANNVSCFGGNNGSATVSASGNGPFGYSWLPSGGNAATATGLAPGSYSCTVTDVNGCTSIQPVTITQPASSLSLNGTSTPESCGASDGGAAVGVTGGTPGYTYSWSTGGTGAIETGLAFGIYTVVVTDANGCAASVQVSVGGTGSAVANAGPDATITQGQSAVLAGSGSGNNFSWSPANDLSCSGCPDPTASPTVTTVYTLTVTDSNGCVATDIVIIYVDINCGEVFLPNAFSPNGDNENDVLYVRGNCIKSMQFEIYNRWGERVFLSTDPASGWNGEWRGQPCEPAVFTYVLQATLLDGTKLQKSGNVTLVK